MSKDTTDLREQLEVMLDKFNEWADWCYAAESMIEKPEEYPKMKLLEDLLALISNREKLAYRNGYAAGNAKKNYRKKVDAETVEQLKAEITADVLATLRKELDGEQILY